MDVPEISVAELEAVLAEGATVVDVREPEEYRVARVPGALLIPLSEVSDRLREIQTDSRVYVICAKGGRSMAAAEFLRAAGADAVNVKGGTDAWIEAGNTVQSGDYT